MQAEDLHNNHSGRSYPVPRILFDVERTPHASCTARLIGRTQFQLQILQVLEFCAARVKQERGLVRNLVRFELVHTNDLVTAVDCDDVGIFAKEKKRSRRSEIDTQMFKELFQCWVFFL